MALILVAFLALAAVFGSAVVVAFVILLARSCRNGVVTLAGIGVAAFALVVVGGLFISVLAVEGKRATRYVAYHPVQELRSEQLWHECDQEFVASPAEGDADRFAERDEDDPLLDLLPFDEVVTESVTSVTPESPEPLPAEAPLESQPDPSEDIAGAPPAAVENAAPDQRPAWLEQPIGFDGSAYRQVVKAGPHPRRLEAEKELRETIDLAIADYVDEALEPGASEFVSLSREYIEKHIVVDDYYEVRRRSFTPLAPDEAMIEMWALLQFDSAVHNEVREQYRQAVIEDRLWVAGFSVAGVLVLLSSVFGMLRVSSPASAAQSRPRLRFTAAAMILALIVAGVLLARWVGM